MSYIRVSFPLDMDHTVALRYEDVVMYCSLRDVFRMCLELYLGLINNSMKLELKQIIFSCK